MSLFVDLLVVEFGVEGLLLKCLGLLVDFFLVVEFWFSKRNGFISGIFFNSIICVIDII